MAKDSISFSAKYSLPRPGALKTKNVAVEFEPFVKLAKFVQKSAEATGHKSLANIARQYKLDMKKAIQNYTGQLDLETNEAQIQDNKHTCLMKLLRIAEKIIDMVYEQANNMQHIYSEAYEFATKLYGQNQNRIDSLPKATGNADYNKVIETPAISSGWPKVLKNAKAPRYEHI